MEVSQRGQPPEQLLPLLETALKQFAELFNKLMRRLGQRPLPVMTPTGAFHSASRTVSGELGLEIGCERSGREAWLIKQPSETISNELAITAVGLVMTTEGQFMTSEMAVGNGQHGADALRVSFNASDLPAGECMLVLRRAVVYLGEASWEAVRELTSMHLLAEWAGLAAARGLDAVLDLIGRVLLSTYDANRMAAGC